MQYLFPMLIDKFWYPRIDLLAKSTSKEIFLSMLDGGVFNPTWVHPTLFDILTQDKYWIIKYALSYGLTTMKE